MIRIDDSHKLAAALQGIRADADLSQKRLSTLTGISTSTISAVERGVTGCTVATLILLAAGARHDLALIPREHE